MSFHLILVDAEIEWLPPETVIGPAPRICCLPGAERQRIRILESYLHRDLMASMPDRHRRGRPDIAHAFLTLVLSSEKRAIGEIDVLVQTRENMVIRFARKANVEKDYIGFLGTLTKLFERGEVGSGDERIAIEAGQSLTGLLDEEKLDFIVALSPVGKDDNLRDALAALKGGEVGILIGGFPEGDFRSPVYELADLVISLGDEVLTVPEVVTQVLAALP